MTKYTNYMNKLKYILTITALTAALTLSARASFVVDDNPSQFLSNDMAHHDVSDFDSSVGANTVHIHSNMGNMNSGAGFATIKPLRGGTLTDVIFTPADNTAFSDFSFRGQLTEAGMGMVMLMVTDSLGNVTMEMFMGLGANQDFAWQGIISLDGSTIQSVELMSNFKEIKQIKAD
jgi:hypothetical protein